MNKKRPANMVVSAMLATIIFIIIANCFMNLWGNSFTTLTAAKTATQAQAYSDIVSEKIKLEGTDAEEVTTKTKLSEITGNDSDDDWFYTYEIENETEDDNGNIFKVASIKIYKDDENGPRYSTEIPLSSLGSSFSVPIGGIIAYTGSLNALPLNYHICDGTNGTPDLRDRFIVGAGNSYNLNNIGGTSTNILALNQLPNGLIFQWGYHNSGNYITFPIKFEHKCINVELTPSVTSWAGDERHPFIKEITNSYIRYEDRGVDQHYGLNPVYWSAFGN